MTAEDIISKLAKEFAHMDMSMAEAKKAFEYMYFADLMYAARGNVGVAAKMARTGRTKHVQRRRRDRLLDRDIDTTDES